MRKGRIFSRRIFSDCILSCFHRVEDSVDPEPDTDTSKKRDRSLLSRREEARLSEIFQKGYTLKQVSSSFNATPASDPAASNCPEGEEESAEADLATPFVDSQDFSAAEMQQVHLHIHSFIHAIMHACMHAYIYLFIHS